MMMRASSFLVAAFVRPKDLPNSGSVGNLGSLAPHALQACRHLLQEEDNTIQGRHG